MMQFHFKTLVWAILLASISSTLALPQGRISRHANRIAHSKRYVVSSPHKNQPASGFQPNAFKHKRYVIPFPKSTTFGPARLDGKNLKRRQLTGTFGHSLHTQSLKRGWDASLDKVKRGVLHPLILYTQHYNKALSRRALATQPGQFHKRAKLAEDLRADAIERLTKRWQGIHEARGIAAPRLELSERGQLIPTSSNMSKQIKRSDSGGKTFNSAFAHAAQSGQTTPSTSKDKDNTLGLDIQGNDIGYSTTFKMGTPGLDFQILVDSGSADLWVPSRQCNQDGNCGGHQTLDSQTSSTLAVSDPLQQFQVTYGSGAVQGVLAQDRVRLPDGALPLDNLTFGITTTESVQFADPSVPFDGLMGLAISTLSNEQVPTYIEALAIQGLVPAAQMGYHLGTVNTDNAPSQDSTVTFGGVDSSKFQGQLIEIPNQSREGFWTGGLDGVSVDGKALQIAGKTAILDTGTSLIIMPQADAEAVHAAIPGARSDGQGGFTLPCTTSAKLAFTFGGLSFAMASSDLSFVPLTDDPAGRCQSSISSGDIDSQGSFLLGAAFLKNTYFATDVSSNTIGLAVAGDGIGQ